MGAGATGGLIDCSFSRCSFSAFSLRIYIIFSLILSSSDFFLLFIASRSGLYSLASGRFVTYLKDEVRPVRKPP
jgi:hypothetical protein